MDFREGEIIAIDKPYGVSSFGALAHIRYLCSCKWGRKVKMGHAGTLDPLATGVLILCTGKMTKRIEEFQHHTKEYVATLQLGATTPSFDMEHEIDATFPTLHITREGIEQALAAFVGDVMQVPPVFSACNVNGKRAYALSRKGKEVELAPKQVRIDEIELVSFDIEKKQLTLRIVCGKGISVLWHATWDGLYRAEPILLPCGAPVSVTSVWKTVMTMTSLAHGSTNRR